MTIELVKLQSYNNLLRKAKGNFHRLNELDKKFSSWFAAVVNILTLPGDLF